MSPFELVWRYLQLTWTLGALLVGLVAVGGLFGGGPLPLVAGAFVVVLTTVGYGVARAVFRT